MGGLVRWTFTSHKFDHLTLINASLQRPLDSSSCDEIIIGNQVVKRWLNEDLGLIYILAYPKMFPITWSSNLFKRIDLFVVKEHSESLKNEQFYEFDNDAMLVKFKEVVKREESKVKESKVKESKVKESNFKESNMKESNFKESKKTSLHSKQPQQPHQPHQTQQTTTNRRSWNDKVSKSDLETLDYSNKDESVQSKGKSKSSHLTIAEKSKLDDLSDFESNSETETPNTWWNSLKSLTGNNPLKRDDLAGPLKEMKLHLMSKNVASDAAEFVIKSVENRLEGQIPGTFKSISKMIKDATREIIRKILTPIKPTDLLTEIESKKRSSSAVADPFVIAFVGVNGVGKSTNLSKVAYWLLQHNFKVLLVAGDTFRAGAVEQLRQHCRNLENIAPGRIEIYERGYGKDAALIAQDAIKYGKDRGFDVVLVDTAGRMQDNGPLMIALAKLINLNRPDRVIFVGEALVGHDALSQLTKFNTALLDHSAKPIDALLLTKVDTIDDKIGAALSMTWVAKAPILFMGVGQTYTDLKRINVKQTVDLLLK